MPYSPPIAFPFPCLDGPVRNRFNRPITTDQVQGAIKALYIGARSRQHTDPLAADVMDKARHIITHAWHELTLHDNLTEHACETIEDVEKALAACAADKDVPSRQEADRMLGELKSLRRRLKFPADTVVVTSREGSK
jgi:hypothetical protein